MKSEQNRFWIVVVVAKIFYSELSRTNEPQRFYQGSNADNLNRSHHEIKRTE